MLNVVSVAAGFGLVGVGVFGGASSTGIESTLAKFSWAFALNLAGEDTKYFACVCVCACVRVRACMCVHARVCVCLNLNLKPCVIIGWTTA
jgi:hypothetical protein